MLIVSHVRLQYGCNGIKNAYPSEPLIDPQETSLISATATDYINDHLEAYMNKNRTLCMADPPLIDILSDAISSRRV